MKGLKVSLITTIALLTAACGGTPQCLEPQPYQRARLGESIRVPEGLDPLDPAREMTIPEPSPRPPRESGAPCLEYPPTLETGQPVLGAEPEQEAESDDADQPR